MSEDDKDATIAGLLGQLKSAMIRCDRIEGMASAYGHETFAREILKMRAGMPNIFGIVDMFDGIDPATKH